MLGVVFLVYRMLFQVHSCVSALEINILSFNGFEVGINDKKVSGNEPQKLFLSFVFCHNPHWLKKLLLL